MFSGSRIGLLLRLIVAASVLVMCVRKHASAQVLPLGRGALPGASQVASASRAPRWASLVQLGYAHTEAVPGSSAVHDRANAEAALSFSPTSSWMIGASGFGRYDAHRRQGKRADEGAAFGSHLTTRLRRELGRDLSLAGELALTFPPANGLKRGLLATSPSLRGIGSYALFGASSVSLNLGARLDRSRHAVDDPARLSADDRIAAGLSKSNALLMGVLGSTRVRDIVLGAEWSWDLFVGSAAPAALASPMRVELFAQRPFSQRWFAGARLGASPSSRPDPSQLSPVEARVWASLMVGYVLAEDAAAPARAPAKSPVVAEPPKPATAAEPIAEPEPNLPPGQIRGRVRNLRGASIRAQVELVPLGQTLTTDAEGAFVLDVPPGRYSVVVRAEGYEEQKRPAEVEQNGVTILVIDLRRAKR